MRCRQFLIAFAVVASSCGSTSADLTAGNDEAPAAERSLRPAEDTATTTLPDTTVPSTTHAAPSVVIPVLGEAAAAQACAEFEAGLMGPENFLD